MPVAFAPILDEILYYAARGRLSTCAAGALQLRFRAKMTAPTTTEPTGLPTLGELIDEKYFIERKLGEGGMGAVFAAKHLLTGKRVAMKFLLPAEAKKPHTTARFRREAKAAGAVDHPNVINVYDVGSWNDAPYLVMEHLHGKSLRQSITDDLLTAEDGVRVMLGVARGVAAAHARGVVHRDLKPDNIILACTEDGRPLGPKVLDFGISKVAGIDEDTGTPLTEAGVVLGTPHYLSPERIRGHEAPPKLGDVYALGVILFEVLTGVRPFRSDNYISLLYSITNAEVPGVDTLNPTIDRGLAEVVRKAMARDPAQRYADVESFGRALEPFVREAFDGETAMVWRTQPTRGRGAVALSAAGPPLTPSAAFALATPSGGATLKTVKVPLWVWAAALVVVGVIAAISLGSGRSSPSRAAVVPDATPSSPPPPQTTPATAPPLVLVSPGPASLVSPGPASLVSPGPASLGPPTAPPPASEKPRRPAPPKFELAPR